jgi:hypothetical protein
MALLFILALVAQPLQANAIAPKDKLHEQCRTRLQQKLNAEITDLTSVAPHRIGRQTILSGTVRALQRTSPPPGEMGTDHVLRLDYSYTCRTRDHSLPTITLTPLHD